MADAIMAGRGRRVVNYAKDWEYTTNDTATLVTKYIGTKRHVVVPNKIEGKPVVLQNGSYSSGVFTNNQNIISVRFSDGVKFTNNTMWGTFLNCSNLVNVSVIPNSVTSMQRMFYGCYKLVNAPVIPNSVTSMDGTFMGCFGLVNAPVIPNSVTDMSWTFDRCYNLINAPVIPANVSDMTGTFNGCYSLVNAPVIPNGVTDMGWAFLGCASLINAPVIPNSVMYMSYTFQSCRNLKGNIFIKSNRIDNTSMQDCFGNTTLPKNVYIPYTGYNAIANTWNAAFNATYGINGKNGVTVMDINTYKGSY